MSLGKKLFIGGTPACKTDTADKFADSSGVALYSLDYDASDASGNYDGVPTDVTFGVDGQINYGAGFNGNSSRIQIASTATAPLNFSSGNFSISMWVNPSNLTNNNKLIYKWGTSASLRNWIATITTNGVLYVVEGTTAGDTLMLGTTTIPINAWTHIAITRAQGGNLVQYINGVATNTFSTQNRSLKTSTEPLYIGYQAGQSTNFTGSIDQVRMFTKELSSTEVSTLYAETACVYTSTTDNNDYPVTNAAYYKLDNNAEDAKGNYDGTATNVNYEFGRFGQAAVFNGSSSYITANKSMFGTGDGVANLWSISLWFKTDGSVNASRTLVATKGSSNQPGFFLFIISGGQLRYYEGNTSSNSQQLTTPASYDDGNWHNVVMTRSGTTDVFTMYIDGTEVIAPTTMTNPHTSHNFNLHIGRYTETGALFWDGTIDQVRIFNSALDATAVENLYNEKPEVNTSNFETVLYTGTGSSGNYVSSVGFYPDLVWLKSRGVSASHKLFDTVRGDTEVMESNSTAQSGVTSQMRGFEGNGFILDGTASAYNGNNVDYVAWCWKGGGDAVNNTDGNITSQVSANQDAGFSIVKWTSTGSGASAKTVGHGLSSTPEMIILKNASATAAWRVYHSGIPSPNNSLALSSAEVAFSFWPSVSSTNFGLAASVTTGESSGSSGQSIIAYCFHSVAGYQKVGGYTGGGSSGKTVTTGFRPSWVMIKRTDVSNYWVIIDSKRDTTDPYSKILWANVPDSEAEGGSSTNISFSDTGFSMGTSVVGSSINASGGTYVYLAIA